MVRDKNFESLSEFGGVQELALILETDVGINGCEADLLFIDIMFLVQTNTKNHHQKDF